MKKKLFLCLSIAFWACVSFVCCDTDTGPTIIINQRSISYRDSIYFKPVGFLSDVLSLEVYLNEEKVATLDCNNNTYIHKYTFEEGGADLGYTIKTLPVIAEQHPVDNIDAIYSFIHLIGLNGAVDNFYRGNVSPEEYDELIEAIRQNLTLSYTVKNGNATN